MEVEAVPWVKGGVVYGSRSTIIPARVRKAAGLSDGDSVQIWARVFSADREEQAVFVATLTSGGEVYLGSAFPRAKKGDGVDLVLLIPQGGGLLSSSGGKSGALRGSKGESMSTQMPVVFDKVHDVAIARRTATNAAAVMGRIKGTNGERYGLDHHGVTWDESDGTYWGGYHWYPNGHEGPWEGLYLVYEWRELSPAQSPEHPSRETWIPTNSTEGYAAWVASYHGQNHDEEGKEAKRVSLEEFMRRDTADLVRDLW